MTTTTHAASAASQTPGPWAADKPFHIDCPIWAGDNCIATAWAAGGASTEANAALIAAAPSMLDELKHAWAVFNAQDSDYMQGQAGQISRLIAKTTGEPWGHFNPDGSYRDFEAAVEAKRLSK